MSGVRIVSRTGSFGLVTGPLDPGVGLAGLPAVEHLGDEGQGFRRLEVADDRQLAVAGAEVFLVELADLADRGRLHAIERLVGGRHVADVVLGVGRHEPGELVRRERLRVRSPLFNLGDPALLHHLEFLGRERGLAEDLTQDVEHGGQVLALDLDVEGGRSQAAATASASATPAATAAQPPPRRAMFLSSASSICWRLRCLVPRCINCVRKPAASFIPFRFSAFPYRSVSCR